MLSIAALHFSSFGCGSRKEPRHNVCIRYAELSKEKTISSALRAVIAATTGAACARIGKVGPRTADTGCQRSVEPEGSSVDDRTAHNSTATMLET